MSKYREVLAEFTGLDGIIDAGAMANEIEALRAQVDEEKKASTAWKECAQRQSETIITWTNRCTTFEEKLSNAHDYIDDLEKQLDAQSGDAVANDMAPYLKNRADMVDGHYCIARRNPKGYGEFWDDKHKKWCSAGSVFELGNNSTPPAAEVPSFLESIKEGDYVTVTRTSLINRPKTVKQRRVTSVANGKIKIKGRYFDQKTGRLAPESHQFDAICELSPAIQPAEKVPEGWRLLPEDLVTHIGDWRMACKIALEQPNKTFGDACYWEHQLKTLGKIEAMLSAQEGEK